MNWNNGLRLVDPTARREQWNDGILGPFVFHVGGIKPVSLIDA
jgi:hypothetical protein